MTASRMHPNSFGCGTVEAFVSLVTHLAEQTGPNSKINIAARTLEPGGYQGTQRYACCDAGKSDHPDRHLRDA